MRPGSRARYLAITALLLLCGGCDTPLSVMRGASRPSERVAEVGWMLIIVAGIVFVGVLAVLLWAVVRRHREDRYEVRLEETGSRWILFGGAAMPTVVLVGIFLVGMHRMGEFPMHPADPDLSIKVVGHQWWWEVDYAYADLTKRFTTANEIHIPVGRPVQLTLISGDVIHSFWVPGLQGKLDLIPGDTNDLRLEASRPGVYRGQCAEYCGAQHAHMAFEVVAEDSMRFAQWVARQRAPAAPPVDSLARLGEQIFVGGPCALCHSVRGTPASGRVAPDLTHVGSRATIAAGMLPNTMGNMEAWITNAQSLKPGAKMPSLTQFSGGELRALARYLEGLK